MPHVHLSQQPDADVLQLDQNYNGGEAEEEEDSAFRKLKLSSLQIEFGKFQFKYNFQNETECNTESTDPELLFKLTTRQDSHSSLQKDVLNADAPEDDGRNVNEDGIPDSKDPEEKISSLQDPEVALKDPGGGKEESCSSSSIVYLPLYNYLTCLV